MAWKLVQLWLISRVADSVRKAGGRLRVTAPPIDASTGGCLWAERYDRELGDVFALQDEIARNVVSVLKVKLLPRELETISKRATSNTAAYECHLQARSTLALAASAP